MDETIVNMDPEEEERKRLLAGQDYIMPTQPVKQGEETKNIFRDMPEGEIGRLIRYKSGRVKLVMANLKFNMQLSNMHDPVLNDIVCIEPNYAGEESNIINLGHPEVILHASTDWCRVMRHAFVNKEEEEKDEKKPTPEKVEEPIETIVI